MKKPTRFLKSPILVSTLVFVGFSQASAQQSSFADLSFGLKSISSKDLLKHIKVLASDEFEGRAPGGKGEALTLDYLIDHFKKLGLKSANPNGSFTQSVPLLGIVSETSASIFMNGKRQSLTFPQDYVSWTPRPVPEMNVENSEIVFVGYGVLAPEYQWDDYKNADLKGKTLLMLVNDPQIPDPKNPSRLDPHFFKGSEMTYYGRWTYKLEIAAKMNAAAVILIHETGPAGYPYFVVINSWSGENFTLKTPDGNADQIPAAAWFPESRARSFFDDLGFDFDTMKRRALQPKFTPIPLRAEASFGFKNSFREITSKNVVAKIDGSKADWRDEHIILTAHWDHLGMNRKITGDQIYNGALDNATGVAGLLELAEMFSKMDPPLNRSILFLATTAEEQGLLGAKYYAENPFIPIHKTLANINLDGLNQWGRTKDVVVIGKGASSLDGLVEWAAQLQGRIVKGDPEAEKGYFYRSDHFQFAKKGVPALFLNAGLEYIGKAKDYGKKRRREYRENDYHKVSDEIKTDWDLSGAVADLQLLGRVIHNLGNEKDWPTWSPDSEFAKLRQKNLNEN